MLVILLFSLFSLIKCDLIDTVVAKDKISSFRPFQSNYARSNSPVSSPTSPRIKLESYKALAGETSKILFSLKIMFFFLNFLFESSS